MAKYTFTGDNPAILVGLIQGVNAEHSPAEGNPEVELGTTVVASLGDTIDTGDDEYISAFLEEARKPAPKSPKTPKPDTTDETSKES
jgi:hypothetical protein